MGFEVQIRRGSECVAGATVRIEHPGGAEEGVTDQDGFARFGYEGEGEVTIFLDGQRRGTYDVAETQSVTIML